VCDPVMTVFGSLNNPEYDRVKVAGDLTNYDVERMKNDGLFMKKFASVFSESLSKSFMKDPVGTASKMSIPEKALLRSIVK